MKVTIIRSSLAMIASLGLFVGLTGCDNAATRHQTNRIDTQADTQKEQIDRNAELQKKNVDRNAEAAKDQVRAQDENRAKAADQQADNLRREADNLEKRADQIENPPATPAPQ
jgi:hypothetical protein